MLTPEQVAELKKQLHSQINHLPEDKKAEAKRQIENLSMASLEEMLEEQKNQVSSESPLRKIASGQIQTYQIDENKSAIAVLDIKPVSKGHVIIIPRQQVLASNKMPTEAFTLGKKISRRINSKLKPKGIEIQTETKFGEQIINVIPYYDKTKDIASSRYNATEEELKNVQLKLKRKIRGSSKPKIKEIKQDATSFILRRRIP